MEYAIQLKLNGKFSLSLSLSLSLSHTHTHKMNRGGYTSIFGERGGVETVRQGDVVSERREVGEFQGGIGNRVELSCDLD